MIDSERLQRFKENKCSYEDNHSYLEESDSKLVNRILSLLNDDRIDIHCMLDAYYYDYSQIPCDIIEKLNLYRDAYLIFGITKKGELISKWVDRWDLDSENPIINGKVIEAEYANTYIPEVKQQFNPNLLSCPISSISNLKKD